MSVPRPKRAVVALLCALGLTGCGAQSANAPGSAPATHPRSAPPATITASSATTTARHPAPATPRPVHRAPAVDPGSLPQTSRLPSAATHAFRLEMIALWRAITTGSADAGRSAFFPERAYAQLKAVADPASDFEARLFGDFRLDVTAAHQLLGSQGASARLIDVRVPAGYAHWIEPNVCLNRVGYYEVPNARLVYDQGGQIRSFGIASMISWRGVWYVVHLGAVVRQAVVGIVDTPSAGTGVAVPSSTC